MSMLNVFSAASLISLNMLVSSVVIMLLCWVQCLASAAVITKWFLFHARHFTSSLCQSENKKPQCLLIGIFWVWVLTELFLSVKEPPKLTMVMILQLYTVVKLMWKWSHQNFCTTFAVRRLEYYDLTCGRNSLLTCCLFWRGCDG